MNHRCGTRYAISMPSTLCRVDDTAGPGHITDASITGAFIETGMELPVLSRVSVKIQPGGGAEPLNMDAQVVRMDGHGIAVEWLEPASGPIDELLDLCLRNRAVPHPLSNPSTPAGEQDVARGRDH